MRVVAAGATKVARDAEFFYGRARWVVPDQAPVAGRLLPLSPRLGRGAVRLHLGGWAGLGLNLNNGSGNDHGVSTGLSLADLRAHLVPARDIEARERRARMSTGSATLDRLLGGGWPRGAVSEIRGARGQGRTSVLLASIAATMQAGHATALIDFGGGFDPRAAARAGVGLDRLLWVRAPDGADANRAGVDRPGRPRRSPERILLNAAETIVSAGGFGLLALDFGERMPSIPSATWIRLRQLVTGPGTVVLVVTAHPVGSLFGATSLSLDRARPQFGAPPLLTAIDTRIDRHHTAGDSGSDSGSDSGGSHVLSLVHALDHAPT
jgi:hypothetical protein